VTETTGDRSLLLQTQPSISLAAGGTSSGLVITVDPGTQYQQMDGFGGSLTDSSAWLIWNKLSPAQQAGLMQELFSPSSGIGISFLRQPMGATDFSANGNYSYDDMPLGQTDPSAVNRDNTVSFQNHALQLERVGWKATLAGCQVTVHQRLVER
jgi:glucosylceramidase